MMAVRTVACLAVMWVARLVAMKVVESAASWVETKVVSTADQ